MTVNWTASDPTPIGPYPGATVDEQGHVVLRFTRFNRFATQPHELYLVANADGAVRSALLTPFPASTGCVVWDYGSIGGDKVAWSVSGDKVSGDWKTSLAQGAIGGSIDGARPRVLLRRSASAESVLSCSSRWLVELSGSIARRYEWTDLSREEEIASPSLDPEGIGPTSFIGVGDDWFWSTNSLAHKGIMAWDKALGSHSLVRWIGDGTRGAWDFGSDGKDMVWEQGEGRPANAKDTDPFPTRSVMTAPYTTDPAKLTPRRLRSDPTLGSNRRYKVGCGLAARATDSNDLMVVRLSDGVAWIVPSSVSPAFAFIQVLAVTCDEVFVAVQGATPQIARIKVGSLGPPKPAD